MSRIFCSITWNRELLIYLKYNFLMWAYNVTMKKWVTMISKKINIHNCNQMCFSRFVERSKSAKNIPNIILFTFWAIQINFSWCMLNTTLEFALKRKNMWEALNRSEIKSKSFLWRLSQQKLTNWKCVSSNTFFLTIWV